MNPSDVIREITYPLTNLAIVLALLFFWLLTELVQASGMFGFVLAVILLPAYMRYLLFLLEARANGRQPPVPSIEMFSLWNNTWALAPTILLALLIWSEIFLLGQGFVSLALLIAAVFVFVLPASLAILSITHSPLESLNPAAMIRMINACGATYYVVPLVLTSLSLAFLLLLYLGTPLIFIDLGTSYQNILLFTLTGAVLRVSNVASEVYIDVPLRHDEDRYADKTEAQRQKVIDHAYGFVSRNNRAGGFAHIKQWLQKDPDINEALAWFFNEMMKWESKTAGLFFAQDCIAHYLAHDDDARALKLMSRCLYEDASWKPRVEDRPHVLELAERNGRDDIVQVLKG